MITRNSDCDPTQLAAVLADSLDAQQQTQVLEHLSGCEHCQLELEKLTADETWWDDARETLAQISETEDPVSLTNSREAKGKHTPCETDSLQPTQLPSEGLSDIQSSGLGLQPKGIPTDAHHESLPPGAAAHHWVLALLQPTDRNDTLGQFDGMPVQSVVGQGGMGVVLKGFDEALRRDVAIKLLSPMLASSGAAKQRFFREAQATAAIVHPNIVPIYAISSDHALPYIVMPYIAGGNLQQYLDAEGPLSLQRVLSIGLQVAEGLAAAHAQGIVHRDIKPANLMLDEGGFRVMLTDFGLARALDDATLTGSGMIAGTPQYMSPEQARGSLVDGRSDLYSLGAVLYALATGRPPVRGDSTMQVLRRIGEEAPLPVYEINEAYPKWFDALTKKLLAPDSSQRLQTAGEAAELLRSCLAHARDPHHVSLPGAVSLQPALSIRSTQLWPSAGQWTIAALATALLVAAWMVPWPGLGKQTDSDAGAISAKGGNSDIGDMPAAIDSARTQGNAMSAFSVGNPTETFPDRPPDRKLSPSIPSGEDATEWEAAQVQQLLDAAHWRMQSLLRELEHTDY